MDPDCPVCATADIVCGKWTLLLVRDLAEGHSRFCELERSLQGISPRTLSLRLRALEEEGIVERHTLRRGPAARRVRADREGPRAAADHRRHARVRPHAGWAPRGDCAAGARPRRDAAVAAPSSRHRIARAARRVPGSVVARSPARRCARWHGRSSLPEVRDEGPRSRAAARSPSAPPPACPLLLRPSGRPRSRAAPPAPRGFGLDVAPARLRRRRAHRRPARAAALRPRRPRGAGCRGRRSRSARAARGGRWSPWVPLAVRRTTTAPTPAPARRASDPVWTGGADELQLRARGPVRPRCASTSSASSRRPAPTAPRRARGRRAPRAAAQATGPGGAAADHPARDLGRRRGPAAGAPTYGDVQVAFVHHTVTANDYAPAGLGGDRARRSRSTTATRTAGTTSATTSSSTSTARSSRAAPAASTRPSSAPRRRATTATRPAWPCSARTLDGGRRRRRSTRSPASDRLEALAPRRADRGPGRRSSPAAATSTATARARR